MPELTGEQLGPAIKTTLPDKETRVLRPYQELKERLGPQKYDAVIVFGQGPIKKVIFSDELTAEQKKQWQDFTSNVRTQKEPDFRVLDYNKARGLIKDAPSDRNELKKSLEQADRFAYKRYGRLNALAAGMMLYTDKTDKIILSGGRTIPADKINQGNDILSEAEAMRDHIIRHIGPKMYERDKAKLPPKMTYEEYKNKVLMKHIILEDSATNTIDNIIRSINHDPETFFKKEKAPEIGLLGSDHQVERCVTLLNLFTGNEKGAHPISSTKDVLKLVGEVRDKSMFLEILQNLTDEEQNRELQEMISSEKIGQERLEKPEDLFWWLGYVGHSEVPQVFQAVMTKLKQPKWRPFAKKGFDLLGLDFEYFSKVNFAKKPNEMVRMKVGFEKILTDGGVLRKQKLVI